MSKPFGSNRYRCALLGLACSYALAPSAEILGVNVGVNYWHGNMQGWLRSADSIDTTTDESISGTRFSIFEMGLTDVQPQEITFELRHRIPLAPRLMIAQQTLTTGGTVEPSRNIQWFDSLVLTGAPVTSSIDLKHTQLTLYYTLRDSWYQLETGLSQRRYSGAMRMQQAASTDEAPAEGEETAADISARVAISETADLLFLNAGVDIPESPLNLSYTRYASFGGDHHSDTAITLRVAFDGFYGKHYVSAGYRKAKIKSEGFAAMAVDLNTAGPFVGWTYAL